MKTADPSYCPSFHTLNLSTLCRLSVTFQSLLPMFLDFTQLQITYKEQERHLPYGILLKNQLFCVSRIV